MKKAFRAVVMERVKRMWLFGKEPRELRMCLDAAVLPS